MHKTDARTLLSSRNGMNIYRGCQHGCIYCDSRSKCYQFTHWQDESFSVLRTNTGACSDSITGKGR